LRRSCCDLFDGLTAGLAAFPLASAFGEPSALGGAAWFAGTLVTVGIGVVAQEGRHGLEIMEWGDRAVLLLALTLAAFWQLVHVVALELVLAALQLMKYMGERSSRRFESRTVESSDYAGVVVKFLHGPLFFGNASAISDWAIERDPKVERSVIELSDARFIDQSGDDARDAVGEDGPTERGASNRPDSRRLPRTSAMSLVAGQPAHRFRAGHGRACVERGSRRSRQSARPCSSTRPSSATSSVSQS
jgi:MFS superfamily sulfate permease-like transporter